MKHFSKLISTLLTLSIATALLCSACAPAQSVALAETPEPTPSATAAPTPTPSPTPEPTPTSTPEPRVIEVEMDQELQGVKGAVVVAKRITYVQNQSISITLIVQNNDDDIYLIAPGFASVNGWGFVLYPKVKSDNISVFQNNAKTSITLVAELDETTDQLMNITQIQNVTVDVALMRFDGSLTMYAKSGLYTNPDCPEDYVQPHPVLSDSSVAVSKFDEKTFVSADLNDIFWIDREVYDQNTQRLFYIMGGSSLYGKPDALLANSGVANLALDGTTTGRNAKFYLPNGGYTVFSFDLSDSTGFDPELQRRTVSFLASDMPDHFVGGFLWADFTPDALEQGYIRSLDESGVVWKETSTYKLIYKGFNYVSAVRPSYGDGALEAHNCIEFLLVNKSQDDALGVYTDKMSINGTDLSPRITKSVIPPQCAGIVQIDVPSRWWPDGMKNMEDGRFALTLKILKPGGVVIDTIEQVIEPSK